MNVPRRVPAYLTLAEEDVDAAEGLAQRGNRYAAYHCQQAIEKLLKALLLHKGIEAGLEHRLDVLIGKLPADDEWVTVLRALDRYTPYATTFRYPTPGGIIPAAPNRENVLLDCKLIRELLEKARKATAG